MITLSGQFLSYLGIPIKHGLMILAKPFEKENELTQLKKDVSKLDREISIKIQANQMKQHNATDDNKVEIKEAPVIKMDGKESKPEKTLLPKKKISQRKEKSLRI